ncbi:putative Xaa-Pro aminopeptidase Fra1p [[Candida] jaroonii]|uniref:Xaa-Pro aminopeptidase Fra1p n=1 Tax=[Candida] jaroonii TaxID=467808 RepID=A0ACA9Y0X4_9ASCO|nr:putative Xaa-Pro aminopeptidase Fra1p [[Candida] jaroonii]
MRRAQCNNCTCSPGLLARNNRRSSLIARQIHLKRTGSSSGSRPGSRKGSVFSIDPSVLCEPEAKEVNTSKRLEKVRNLMEEYNLGVYIVPSEDAHQSEYTSSIDQRRSFISGFQGSAGVAVITRDVTCMNSTPEGLAVLSTDGRYFNQALNELDFNWTLLRQGAMNEPTWEDWSIDQAIQLSLDSGSKINIGVDPKLITYQSYLKFTEIISRKLKLSKNVKAEVEFVAIKDNLITSIWDQFEPLPKSTGEAIKLLDLKYCGESFESKLNKIVDQIKKNNGNALIISSLDEIAWLLNLRGNDIPYNPLFFSYLIINSLNEVILFIDSNKISSEVEKYLNENNIKIKPYEEFWDYLFNLSKDYNLKGEKLLVNQNVSWEIVRSLKCSFTQLSRSPIEDLKSIKNEIEIKGAKNANIKDGRALCKFFSWLENEIILKGEILDEIQADLKLTEFRKQEEDFVGLSFSTISSSGANSAIIHYSPSSTNYSMINPDSIYLNDSGSHFLDGTTDTTRTIHLTTPTSLQKRNYTLVLKGVVSLSSLEFPENTLGSYLDSIARQHLWKYNLDYAHGTSHGIGSYLNVHEGPMSIGLRPSASTTSIKPGNIISNEPGYYEDGEYGIRIENDMVVVDTGKIYNGKKFYKFETLTRVPFCRKLIDTKLLTKEEKLWINEFHKTIWNDLSTSFTKGSFEYNWLLRETTAL